MGQERLPLQVPRTLEFSAQIAVSPLPGPVNLISGPFFWSLTGLPSWTSQARGACVCGECGGPRVGRTDDHVGVRCVWSWGWAEKAQRLLALRLSSISFTFPRGLMTASCSPMLSIDSDASTSHLPSYLISSVPLRL